MSALWPSGPSRSTYQISYIPTTELIFFYQPLRRIDTSFWWLDTSFMWLSGPALTAVWSKAPPATDCTLSLTTACVRIPTWACEKVASDLGLGGGFRQVLGTN